MEQRLLDVLLGALVGGTVAAVFAMRYVVKFVGVFLNEIAGRMAPAPRPRIVKKPEPKTEPLPFAKDAPPKEPRTNFDPPTPTLPFTRPSMRSYLAKLQKSESGPLVEGRT